MRRYHAVDTCMLVASVTIQNLIDAFHDAYHDVANDVNVIIMHAHAYIDEHQLISRDTLCIKDSVSE